MRKVLIYRPDNIGDVLLFSGALKHIRSLYPEAHITLAVQDHICDLFGLCPHIDACVSLERLEWPITTGVRSLGVAVLDRWMQRLQRFANTHGFTYDIVLFPLKTQQIDHLKQLYRLRYGNLIGVSGGYIINSDAGYPARLAPENLGRKTLDVSGKDPWRHEFLTTMDFLNFLGCSLASIDDVLPELWLSSSRGSLLPEGKRIGNKIVGIFPCAAIPYRNWAVENYPELAEKIREDVTYVLFGGEGDLEFGAKVAASLRAGNAGCEVLDLVGQTSLRELCEMIKSCDLFISMETSGLHIAIALGIPTIGIVGGGHYGRFIPWGDSGKTIFLTKHLECFNCGWFCVRDRVECIQGVSPREVSESVNSMLERL